MSRSIEQLVDQQVLKWMAERQIADRASWRPGPIENGVEERHRPIICISRQGGALGAHRGRIGADVRGSGLRGRGFLQRELKGGGPRAMALRSFVEHGGELRKRVRRADPRDLRCAVRTYEIPGAPSRLTRG